MKQGLEHKGFAFIDVFSPCVTYNHDNTYPWFKERVKKLEDDPHYDPSAGQGVATPGDICGALGREARCDRFHYDGK